MAAVLLCQAVGKEIGKLIDNGDVGGKIHREREDNLEADGRAYLPTCPRKLLVHRVSKWSTGRLIQAVARCGTFERKH